MTPAHDAEIREQPFSVVWRLRDREKLERELEIAFGRADSPYHLRAVIVAFEGELHSHPLEWPLASRSPSEHTWRFDQIQIRYRLIPVDQAVEIISVSGKSD
jgi:hypothetical protein